MSGFFEFLYSIKGAAAGAGFMVGALFNVLAGMLGARVRAGRPQDATPESTGEQAAPRVVGT